MGNPGKEACCIFSVVQFHRSSDKWKLHRMFIPLALLFLVAAHGCASVPTKWDSIRNSQHDIVNIAQITLVHITKLRTKLPVGPQIEVSSPSIEGLTSISHDLGLLDIELRSPFTELLGQIQADVSSLEGRVRSLALTLDCPVQARPNGETGDSLFPHSQLYLALTKVQHYLDKLLLNKDKLKVC